MIANAEKERFLSLIGVKNTQTLTSTLQSDKAETAAESYSDSSQPKTSQRPELTLKLNTEPRESVEKTQRHSTLSLISVVSEEEDASVQRSVSHQLKKDNSNLEFDGNMNLNHEEHQTDKITLKPLVFKPIVSTKSHESGRYLSNDNNDESNDSLDEKSSEQLMKSEALCMENQLTGTDKADAYLNTLRTTKKAENKDSFIINKDEDLDSSVEKSVGSRILDDLEPVQLDFETADHGSFEPFKSCRIHNRMVSISTRPSELYTGGKFYDRAANHSSAFVRESGTMNAKLDATSGYRGSAMDFLQNSSLTRSNYLPLIQKSNGSAQTKPSCSSIIAEQCDTDIKQKSKSFFYYRHI